MSGENENPGSKYNPGSNVTTITGNGHIQMDNSHFSNMGKQSKFGFLCFFSNSKIILGQGLNKAHMSP